MARYIYIYIYIYIKSFSLNKLKYQCIKIPNTTYTINDHHVILTIDVILFLIYFSCINVLNISIIIHRNSCLSIVFKHNEVVVTKQLDMCIVKDFKKRNKTTN